jgi:hypothetical protein
VVTLLIFAAFSALYLENPLTWIQGFGFFLIAADAFFVFHPSEFSSMRLRRTRLVSLSLVET